MEAYVSVIAVDGRWFFTFYIGAKAAENLVHRNVLTVVTLIYLMMILDAS